MIDSENDVTTLHVMNRGGSPLGVEEDEAEQTADIIKRRMKNTNLRDVMNCNDAMIGKDNEKNAPLGLRLMKLLNNACIH